MLDMVDAVEGKSRVTDRMSSVSSVLILLSSMTVHVDDWVLRGILATVFSALCVLGAVPMLRAV